jgi:hypothetical protein
VGLLSEGDISKDNLYKTSFFTSSIPLKQRCIAKYSIGEFLLQTDWI